MKSDDLGSRSFSEFYEPYNFGKVITIKIIVITKAGCVEPFPCAKYCAKYLTEIVTFKSPKHPRRQVSHSPYLFNVV